MSDLRKKIEEKKEKHFREKKLSLISGTVKGILESAEASSLKHPFKYVIQTVVEAVDYFYKEKVEFVEIENKKNEKTYDVNCLGETLMTIGITIVSKDELREHDLDEEIEKLDLRDMPEELKSEIKKMLTKLTEKLN